MFRGEVLGKTYYTWQSYKNAYNEAVEKGLLYDKNGRKVTNKI